ncbi:MAG TPA: hypothetical protein VJB02_00880 [Coxiellaceae bacterium]|nr:hypothetical protein [Coxiellaceae bacterium]
MRRTRSESFLSWFSAKQDSFSQAECYFLGKGVERNFLLARKFYRQAIREGNTAAHFRLGLIYHTLSDNNEKAAKAYFKAFLLDGNLCAKPALQEMIREGSQAAQFYFAQICIEEQQWEEAQKNYAAAISREYPPAMYWMGKLYEQDRISRQDFSVVTIRKNRNEELRWYKEAALRGYERAVEALIAAEDLKDLAFLYLAEAFERGVTPSQERALEYYRQAEVHGRVEAMLRLGRLIEAGEWGVERNVAAACEHYFLAAKQLNVDALAALERLVEPSREGQIHYQLAEVYQQFVRDKQKALIWYKRAADRGFIEADIRLDELSKSDSEFGYAVAKAYEQAPDAQQNLIKAFFYYALSARNGYRLARESLEKFAEEGNAHAQFSLGYGVYHQEGQTVQAITWCMRAAEQRHRNALHYLNTTDFSGDICLEIARRYDTGEGVTVQAESAVAFYIKAHAKNNTQATIRLAQIYERGECGQVANVRTAFEYYRVAVTHGESRFLSTLEEITTVLSDPQLECKLAYVHYLLGNKVEAAKWYKSAMDKGREEAASEMRAIAGRDAVFAYHVAQTYEAVVEREERRSPLPIEQYRIALTYYVMAVRNGHVQARELIQSKALEGDVDAEYALGYLYFNYDHDHQSAAIWLMKAAEKGHEKALQHLTRNAYDVEAYLEIARRYEVGEGVAANIERAIHFYTKLYELKHPRMALKLGQLYELYCEGGDAAVEKACRYYIEVVTNGQREVLAALCVLAEGASPDVQLAIADLLESPALHDQLSAEEWRVRAGRSTGARGPVPGRVTTRMGLFSPPRVIPMGAAASQPAKNPMGMLKQLRMV